MICYTLVTYIHGKIANQTAKQQSSGENVLPDRASGAWELEWNLMSKMKRSR